MQPYPSNEQPTFAPPPVKPPKRPFYRRRGCLISLGVVLVLLVAFVALGLYGETLPAPAPAASVTPTSQPTHIIAQATTAPTATPKPKPTIKPTAKPTPAPASHWPPKTQADLHALAALGNASAIQEIHSESVGLGSCPQPKRSVLVDPSVTGKQLVEDLLAYWYAQQLENPCGAVVFAYHSQAEYQAGNGYTAGRILLNVADASGQANTDPNATGLKYALTLDTGSALDPNAQEYVVNW